MTWVDLAVLGVVAVSALLAFMRGLVREVLGLGAWVGAGRCRLLGLPSTSPAAAAMDGRAPGPIRSTSAALFVVALIVLMLDRPLDRPRWCAARRWAALTGRWGWYSAWPGCRCWSSLPISWSDW